MKKLMAFFVAGFFLLNLVPSVFAGHHGHGKTGGGQCSRGGGSCCSGAQKDCAGKSECPMVSALLMQAYTALEYSKDLGLTDDQVNAIREIKMETKKFSIRMDAEMKIAKIDMKSKFKADKFDAEGLKKMVSDWAAKMPEGPNQMIDWYAKFRSTLNEDQWQKLKELL